VPAQRVEHDGAETLVPRVGERLRHLHLLGENAMGTARFRSGQMTSSMSTGIQSARVITW
jgi:hypothetical protein